jgi:aldehyde dehydrogenase (NAD+)
MVGAIAAGCPVALKPSECTPATSSLMVELVPKYLDPAAYAIVSGAVEETKALLELPWGHIFFTGSSRVGRIVAAAAARYTTPLTLELGGKSPVIVSADCDVELSAKRLLYGKVQNVGQVSPSFAPSHNSGSMLSHLIYAALRLA